MQHSFFGCKVRHEHAAVRHHFTVVMVVLVAALLLLLLILLLLLSLLFLLVLVLVLYSKGLLTEVSRERNTVGDYLFERWMAGIKSQPVQSFHLFICASHELSAV